jgi:hypothetical protein
MESYEMIIQFKNGNREKLWVQRENLDKFKNMTVADKEEPIFIETNRGLIYVDLNEVTMLSIQK